MSDTSEAPSLASHVRRVRVPSQASDVDQFLDELFSPVLDPNIDELSDARSLAASIKGGKELFEFVEDILTCDYSTDLNELKDPSALQTSIKGGGREERADAKSSKVRKDSNVDSVDDYISDLFDPIFVTDSLKRLTDGEGLSGAIKGGGVTPRTATANTSLSFGGLGSPGMPATTEALAAALGLQLPPDEQQQSMQRAFLQSAVAQNIHIQQQLRAQNQALQSLLAGRPAVVRALVHDPPPASTPPSSPGAPPPPPPPLPPPLPITDPSESRPFMDPYGRAKTVRIGKWRWPPPKDAVGQETAEDFTKFKMRQIHRRHTPQSQPGAPEREPRGRSRSEVSVGGERDDQDERDAGPQRAARRSFEVGAQRPSPGSVGKLKLSSEMRQRLERVTASHSVRSSSPAAPRTVSKLEDTRRLMLERQLGGGAPPPPPQHPAPPPPRPPPAAPAPPPPVPDASFAQLRRDRDTFGVHQNADDDRHAFVANWSARDAPPPPTWGSESDARGDEGPRRDEWDSESGTGGRGRGTSEIYELRPPRAERKESGQDSYSDDFERYDGRKNSRDMLVGRARDSPRSGRYTPDDDRVERPTFKTHMAQKERDRKLEAERRHSVSTHVTDRTEHVEREYFTYVGLIFCRMHHVKL